MSRFNGVRALRTLGLVGLMGATSFCGRTTHDDAPRSPAIGGAGGAGGSTSSSSTSPTSTSSGEVAGGTGGDAANAGGAAGAAGAEPMAPALTCAGLSDDDPRDRCEPKLRALLMRHEDIYRENRDDPLRTFEYDDAGRLVTVGDSRDHADYFLYRYTYDDAGRVRTFETSDCFDCPEVYEFDYADAGWLQTVASSHGERTTYREDGQVVEALSDSRGWRYLYRDDGQVDAVETLVIDARGMITTGETYAYEYGDDDRLDRAVRGAEAWEITAYEYIVEGNQVRVELAKSYGVEATIFDDFSRPAFRLFGSDGLDGDGYLGEILLGFNLYSREPGRYGFDRFLVEVPNRLFPYQPFELTENDIDDFAYEYPLGGYSYDFERRVRFSDEGLLEHLTLSVRDVPLGNSAPREPVPLTLDLDVQRCGGVVIETADFSHTTSGDEASVYYYGCDDFELPDPLPEF